MNKTKLDEMPMLKAIIAACNTSSSELSGRVVCLGEADSASPRVIFKKREDVGKGEANEAYKKIKDRLAEGPLGFEVQTPFLCMKTSKDDEGKTILSFDDLMSFYAQVYLRNAFRKMLDEPAGYGSQSSSTASAGRESDKDNDANKFPLVPAFICWIIITIAISYIRG